MKRIIESQITLISMRTKEICSQTSTVEFGMKPISIL